MPGVNQRLPTKAKCISILGERVYAFPNAREAQIYGKHNEVARYTLYTTGKATTRHLMPGDRSDRNGDERCGMHTIGKPQTNTPSAGNANPGPALPHRRSRSADELQRDTA